MRTIGDKIKDIEKEKDDVSTNIKQRQREIAAQVTEERNLRDNLDLRKKRKEIELKGEELVEKEEQLGGLDVSNMVREERKLRQEQDKCLKEVRRTDRLINNNDDDDDDNNNLFYL